jgi:hypothetical protein
MIIVGDDWAEDHHDVYVVDADGARLTSRRLPEGLAGITHRTTHRSRAAHRRLRRDHPRRGGHHRRAQPPDQRP